MKRNAVSLSFFLSLMLLTGCTDSINNESKSNNKKVEESDSIEETSFDIKKEYLVRAHVLDKVYEFTYPKPLNPHVIVDLLMPINDDVDEEIKAYKNYSYDRAGLMMISNKGYQNDYFFNAAAINGIVNLYFAREYLYLDEVKNFVNSELDSPHYVAQLGSFTLIEDANKDEYIYFSGVILPYSDFKNENFISDDGIAKIDSALKRYNEGLLWFNPDNNEYMCGVYSEYEISIPADTVYDDKVAICTMGVGRDPYWMRINYCYNIIIRKDGIEKRGDVNIPYIQLGIDGVYEMFHALDIARELIDLNYFHSESNSSIEDLNNTYIDMLVKYASQFIPS